jgi:hypothetical protein
LRNRGFVCRTGGVQAGNFPHGSTLAICKKREGVFSLFDVNLEKTASRGFMREIWRGGREIVSGTRRKAQFGVR